jgi:hypothetical protein
MRLQHVPRVVLDRANSGRTGGLAQGLAYIFLDDRNSWEYIARVMVI